MRFNKLTMQAFGTFNNLVTIDFTNLNKGGIFLITGPTGAGKTTIFDAICFALYGELSSISNSQTEKIRSDYAKSDLITYVELEFEINKKKYFIKRIPQQENILTKKGNIGSIKHDVLLQYDDITISDIKGVSEKINEIIGLTCPMFKQVVMLPQNEFRKLLNAKTSEKEYIFRNVFSTSFIKDFQEKINNDCKEKIRDIEEKTTILNTLISRIDEDYKDINNLEYQNYDDIISDINLKIFGKKKELELKKNKLNEASINIKKLNEAYLSAQETNKLIIEFNNAKERLIELNNDNLISKYRIILEKYQNALALDNAKKLYDETNNLITEAKDSIIKYEGLEKEKTIEKDNAKEKRLELENRKEEIDELKLKKLSLTQEKESSILKEKVRKEFLNLDEALNDLSIDNENDKERKDKLLNEKQELEIIVNDLKEKVEDISNLYMEKETLNKELMELNNIGEKLEKKEELKALIIDCDLEFDRLKKENIHISSLKEKTKRKLQLNIASTLAHNLKDGVPCPVCGSKEHPNLALFDESLDEDSLTKILADEARNNAQTDTIIEDKRAHASNRVIIEDYLANSELVNRYSITNENISQIISDYEKRLDDIQNRITEAQRINLLYSEKSEELNNLNNDIFVISSRIDSFAKDNEERLEQLRDKKAQLKMYEDTRDLETIEREISDISIVIDEYENSNKYYTNLELDILNEIIELSKNISTKNSEISAYKAKLDIYSNEIDKYKNLFNSDEEYELCLNENNEEIKKYVKEYDENMAIVTNKIKELEMVVENKTVVDLSILENDINLANESLDLLNKETINLESLINNMDSQISDIKSSYDLMKDKIIEKNRLKKLCDIANGNYASRITFEQYILSMYFEDVIDEANILLKDMSKNRFKLIRRKTLVGRGYQGLEVDLFDSKTTSTRSVDTFSGGESFIASLSLALGLSNVIRRNSSLVSVDTLFIDEGFGSLDMDTLDTAYNILCGLRTNDRVIGIISHVSELKSRVVNQIVVKKTDTGSTVNIID